MPNTAGAPRAAGDQVGPVSKAGTYDDKEKNRPRPPVRQLTL